jgi:hypothetical protein
MKKSIKTNYTKLYSIQDLETLVWLLQHFKHYVNLINVDNLTGNFADAKRLNGLGLINWYWYHKTGTYHVHLTEFGKQVAITYAKNTDRSYTEYDLINLPKNFLS